VLEGLDIILDLRRRCSNSTRSWISTPSRLSINTSSRALKASSSLWDSLFNSMSTLKSRLQLWTRFSHLTCSSGANSRSYRALKTKDLTRRWMTWLASSHRAMLTLLECPGANSSQRATRLTRGQTISEASQNRDQESMANERWARRKRRQISTRSVPKLKGSLSCNVSRRKTRSKTDKCPQWTCRTWTRQNLCAQRVIRSHQPSTWEQVEQNWTREMIHNNRKQVTSSVSTLRQED